LKSEGKKYEQDIVVSQQHLLARISHVLNNKELVLVVLTVVAVVVIVMIGVNIIGVVMIVIMLVTAELMIKTATC